MIHYLEEGGRYAHGLSVWRKDDPKSAGFVVRLGGAVLRVRWSKVRKRFFINAYIEPKDPTPDPEPEFIYVPGYTEFVSELAQKKFGYGTHKRDSGRLWGGVGEYGPRGVNK